MIQQRTPFAVLGVVAVQNYMSEDAIFLSPPFFSLKFIFTFLLHENQQKLFPREISLRRSHWNKKKIHTKKNCNAFFSSYISDIADYTRRIISEGAPIQAICSNGYADVVRFLLHNWEQDVSHACKLCSREALHDFFHQNKTVIEWSKKKTYNCSVPSRSMVVTLNKRALKVRFFFWFFKEKVVDEVNWSMKMKGNVMKR